MRTSIALLALCLLAGCGGDDKGSDTGSSSSSSNSSGADAAKVKGQDATAKANARLLVTYVEACFTSSNDYSGCTTADALGAGDLEFGSGPGQLEVTDADASGYTVVSHSESGNTYSITKSDTGNENTCEAKVETDACAGGTW